MTRKHHLATLARALLITVLATSHLVAADLTENFNSWSFATSASTFTNSGWVASNAMLRAENYSTSGDARALWFEHNKTNSLTTPMLTNGFGVIGFDTKTRSSTDFPFSLRMSTNQSGPWTLLAAYTNTAPAGTITSWTFSTNEYRDVYLQLASGIPSVSMQLFIDNVRITEAPAKVEFGAPYTDPGDVFVGQAPHIFAAITPSALASNLSAYVIYTAGGQTGTNTMFKTNSLWRTVNPLPSQSVAGLPVQFTVWAEFEGTNALSPVSVSSSYTVLGIPFASDYEAMRITGGATRDMVLVDDHLWRGIITLPAATNSLAIRFEGDSTNGTDTLTWGDTSPVSSNLIIRGTAATNDATAIATGSLPAGQIAFFFTSSSGDYEINDAAFNDFEEWTGADTNGTYTSNGWQLVGGRIAGGSDDRLRGARTAVISTNAVSALRSPERTGGIGEISFWLRLWETNLPLPSTSCDLQISQTGGTNASEWVTLTNIVVNATDYNRYAIPMNSRSFHYARLAANPDPESAEILVDEFMVTSPGSGILMSGLTPSPSSPTVTNSVAISVDLETFRGAVVTNMTAWWRTVGDVSFNNIAMTETTPGIWSTVSEIPEAQGNGADGLGAGDVEYYVSADFSGYRSEDGSPAYTPALGSGDPAVYTVQPARVLYTSVFNTPAEPKINTGFTVTTDLEEVAAAYSPNPVLFYRTGTSGSFSPMVMTTAGSNRYASVSEIPVPSQAGTPIQYYIQTTFAGPSALSPTNYPAGGAAGPAVVLAWPEDPASAFDTVGVTGGDFTGSLHLTGDAQWRGIISLAAPEPTPAFAIQGSGTNSVTWGDNSASAATPPHFSTAVTNQSPVTLSGTWSNDFMLVFNETSGLYSLRQVHYQDFSDFPPTDSFTPGVPVTTNGWSILNATVFSTNTAFAGNTLRLGGPGAAGTNSHVQSPVLSGGIGSIGFWYRNLDDTGSKPGRLDIRVRSASKPAWETVGSLTNILTPEYLYHETRYASDATDIEVRLEWGSTNNPQLPVIAVDDLSVARLFAYTAFSNVVHTPTAPSITSTVTIAADISPVYSATGITVTAWYRLGTSGNFTAAGMVTTGSSAYATTPPLPRGEPGVVQYYLQSTFDTPHGDGPFDAFAPHAGPEDPFAYTNSDAYAAYTAFTTNEGWVADGGNTSTQTNDSGWVVNQGRFRATTYSTNSVDAAWMNLLEAAPAYILSPWLDLGVGTVRISVGNRQTTGDNEIEIQSSTDGANWTTNATLAFTTKSYQDALIPINTEDRTILRFLHTGSSAANNHLGFDEIAISYPAANVAISNVTFHPLYPSASETVLIACDIASASSFAPALDITARVYYKASSVTNWSGPIEMSRDNGHYITASGIPAYPSGTTVDYYVESTFKGYSRLYSFNPATEPADPDTAPLTYTVRTHASSYDTIGLACGGISNTMVQAGNNQWEGELRFLSETDEPAFLIEGFDFYNGTNLNAGLATIWGDDNQSRTNLPLSGTAQAGGAAITIPELARGQYIIRFDEGTRLYTVQRAAFQDFNTWPASATLFEESYDAAEITQYAPGLGDWSLSDPAPLTNVFATGWTNIHAYPYTATFPPETKAVGDAGNYKLHYGVVITQAVGTAAMLVDSDLSGEVRTTIPASTGVFSFEARCANPTVFVPAIYTGLTNSNVMISADIQITGLPANSSLDSVGYAYKSVIANYIDANNYYEGRVVQMNATQKRYEIWEKSGGSLNLRNNTALENGSITAYETINLTIHPTTGGKKRLRLHSGTQEKTNWEDTSPLTTSTQIGVNGMDATLQLNSVNVYAISSDAYSTTNLVYEQDFSTTPFTGWSDGGGVWTSTTNGTYRRPGYVGVALGMTVETSTDQVSWTTVTNFTGKTHTEYRRYEALPHMATSVYARVRHTDGTGHLIIDNIRSEGWRGKTISQDNWLATNAWVTADTNNAHVLELRGSRTLAGELLYIQSPSVSGGVAVVAFDYKSITGNTNALVFALEYTRTNAVSSWLSLVAFTNAASTNWNAYSYSVERSLRPAIHRIRVRNDATAQEAGILLKNITITEPVVIDDYTWWGYNVLVTSTRPTGIFTNASSPWLAPVSGNVKGAYLNNSTTNGTGGIAYSSYYPSVQSAYLPEGIGEIRFLYRAWDTNASAIQIVAATNRLLPDAQWDLIDTVTVTNTTFAEYRGYVFDRDNRYVKLRVNTGIGTPGRVAIENLLVTSPFAANLRMRNLSLIPEIPTINDDVYVRVEVYDLFYNPSNIVMQLYFEQGTNNWGEYLNPVIYNMALVDTGEDSLIYQTLTPITKRSEIDTVIQYQTVASFEGFFAEQSSPRTYSTFENPDHYWPVDLNLNQPKQTPYYYSLSCLPGQVWINEFNILDASTYGMEPAGQFVELVGKGNVNIHNWRLESINTDFSTNASYSITNIMVIGTATDAYGFYVLGQADITGRDHALTNALPISGGLQLVRSMGAFEQQVSYDSIWGDTFGADMVIPGTNKFLYAELDDSFDDGALTMIGTGSNRTDVVWNFDAMRATTIGTTNNGQTLVPWPDFDGGGEGGYSGTAIITNAWRSGGRVYMGVTTESEGLNLTPRYTTNLTGTITWSAAASPTVVRAGTNYTVSCTEITNAPAVFYRVYVTE